jgi:uncharacterized protein YeaO (DUF488 family)
MTEHQTRVTVAYRLAMKSAESITARRRRKQDEAMEMWFKYVTEFRKAFRGGDRFSFSRYTRRYLEDLRTLTKEPE